MDSCLYISFTAGNSTFFVTTGPQDSLGGSAKTLMFVNCSPASSNCEEGMIGLVRKKAATSMGFISKTERVLINKTK